MDKFLGTLIAYKNIPTFLSGLQRKVLNTDLSHFSIYIGKNYLGRMEEFEANIQVDTTTFRNDPDHRRLFMPIGVPQDYLAEILDNLIESYEETTYGFIGWLAIFLRRCFEWMGFKNVKSWKILWGWGVFCSELVYYYLGMLAYTMSYDEGWLEFLGELNTYNPNTFTPADADYLLSKYTNLFKQIKEIV